MRRLRAAAALVLALAAAAAARTPAAAPPPFHVPASSAAEQAALRDGAKWLASFREQAATEAESQSVLRRMLPGGRRGCWGEAVAALQASCGNLSEDASRRLALQLANCQLAASGLRTYECAASQRFQDCTQRMNDKAWTSYTAALEQSIAVCYFLAAEAFSAQALDSVDRLHAATADAARSLGALGEGMNAALGAQAALAASQAAVSEGLRAIADSQSGLESLQLHALEGQQQLLSGQAALSAHAATAAATLSVVAESTHAANATLSELFASHQAAAAATLARLRALSDGAAALEATQRELLSSSRVVVERQLALASSLDEAHATLAGLAFWQERAARGMGLLLGATFGLDDIVWTAAAVGSGLFATSLPATEAARPLLLLTVGASAAAERTLIPWLVTSTKAAQAVLSVGAVVSHAGVPAPPLAAFAAQLERAELKWGIRKGAVALCAALLVRALAAHTCARAARERAAAAAEARLHRAISDALELHERRLFEALREELAASARISAREQQRAFPPPPREQQQLAAVLFPDLQHCDAPLPLALPPAPSLAAFTPAAACAPPAAGGVLPTPSPCDGDDIALASPAARALVAAATSEPLQGVRLSPVLERAAPPQEPAAAAAEAATAAPSVPPPPMTQQMGASSVSSQQQRRKRPQRSAEEDLADGETPAAPAKRAARARGGHGP